MTSKSNKKSVSKDAKQIASKNKPSAKAVVNPAQDAVIDTLAISCSLYDIDASRNVRRACPKLSNQNLDPYVLVQEMVLVDSAAKHLEFIKLMAQETKIVTLAHSIIKFGQIHPVTVIKNNVEGRKYINVAGQRRYIAIAVLEALIRLKESKVMFDEAVAILSQVKADGDDDAGLELNFAEYITSCDQTIEVKAQVKDISLDRAEDISFEENDETLQMSDLDWGYQFDIMLKTINPQTNKFYTLQDIAKKRKKHYLFVRGRAALPYLPVAWKIKLDDDSISITKAIEKALDMKREAEAKETKAHYDPNAVNDEGEVALAPTGTDAITSFMKDDHDSDLQDAILKNSDGCTAVMKGYEAVEESEDDLAGAEKEHGQNPTDSELKDAEKKKTRKKRTPDIRISTAEIIRKILASNKNNRERVKALAEVIKLTYDEALALTETDVDLHS